MSVGKDLPSDDRFADYGTVPARPGWWIQWDGRHDWFPVSASFAAWVVPEMRDGDRLVEIRVHEEVA